MAAILLDNIINQTIYNSILQESILKNQDQISSHPSSLPSASLAANGNNSQQQQQQHQLVQNPWEANAAGRLQVEREDRILLSGAGPSLFDIGGSPDPLSSSSSNNLDSLAWQNIEMGQYERIFWILLFSIMVLVAAGGNTIVVYIVSTNKEMKSVTNYFLVNLSLADTMVSILNVVFNFISMLISHWPFGKIYCKISNFIAIWTISGSVFTLTAISCDRYNAIVHPLRPRMSHSHALGWILLIWTLSSALAIPNAIYSNLVEDRLANENVAITCTMIWPDGRYPLSSYDHIYNIIILVVTYLVPILTMAILYYRVGKELWGYEAIGENIDKQQRSIMAKKKIVKMMIVVVIIFALCWLPYHAFFIVNYYVPTIFQDIPLYYQRCYLIMYWMAMSNSMYNPIIIYFMNSKFRHEFRKILYRICCCRTYFPPPPSTRSETNHNITTNMLNNHHPNGSINSTRTLGHHQQPKSVRHIVQEARRQSSQILADQLCDSSNNNHHQGFIIKAQENDNNDNSKIRIVVTERSNNVDNNNNTGCFDNNNNRFKFNMNETTTIKQPKGDMRQMGDCGRTSDEQEKEPFMTGRSGGDGDSESGGGGGAAAAAAAAANSRIDDEKLIDFAHGANVKLQSATTATTTTTTLIDSSRLKVWI